MGFEDINECPQLCKVANNYLRKTKNCMDDIYDLLASAPDAESLYVKLVEELDKCILGYFAFHWDLCTTLISQVPTFTVSHIIVSFGFLAKLKGHSRPGC